MQTIDVLKWALAEVRRICLLGSDCSQCPFYSAHFDKCPMRESLWPEDWPTYVWEEDENATD